LYPCSFIFNNNSRIRVSDVGKLDQVQDIPISIINDMHYNFLVDNTPFPYPEGAYPYSSLSISLCNQISLTLSDSYYTLGVRLIYLNVTILAIYVIIIAILVLRNRSLSRKMLEGEQSHLSQALVNLPQEEESDVDNYEEYMNN
jgi:hypothetical protein